MPLLHLTLLGGFQVRLGTGDAASLARKKGQALLAYLVVEPGEVHLRDKLAALLWGDRTDQRARQSLRQTLLALRQALPDNAADVLRIDGENVALNHRGLEVDVVAFEALANDGSPDALTQAAALYTGDFLEGLGVQEPRFEEWLIGQRERLRELAIEVLAKLLAHQTATGAVQEAVQTGGRLLGLDPLQEVVHRALMRLYARQGRRGTALRQYQICTAVLQRELGVEPEDATKQLYQELLQTVPLPSTVPRPAEGGEDLARPAAEGAIDACVPAAPLVGREPEMAMLRRLRGRAWRGEARTAVILGEAGIGKSRLVAAVVGDSLEHGGRALVGRAHETERILPFGPWVEAFRTAGVIPELARAPGLDAVWRVPLTRLFPDLGEPGAASTSAAEEDHVRLFEAMAQALGHLASRQPLLVVLEDLHWADEMSLRLLAFLSRRAASWPVLFVATLRQEEVIDAPAVTRLLRELGREPHFVSLMLAPLSVPDTVTLVRLLGRSGTDEPTVQRLGTQIWHASEGNPFMVVETMRALYGTNASAVADALPTPPRVRDIIAARLDRLSHRGRELAALASVIGREFDFALLENAAGPDGRETAAAVEELVARHVLHVVNERLDFTHERIREVAYERLLPPRRRLLHAAVAHALERLYAHDLAPHYAALSLHCQQGALWDKAFTYLRNTGATAAVRGAHHAAVTCFEQALDALQQLPESHASLEQSIDVRFALRNSLAALGEYDTLSDHLDAAEAAAQTVGDRLRVGWVSAYRTNELFVRGENQAAIASGECASAIAATVGNLRLQVTADLFLGQACHAVGAYRRGADLLRQNMAALAAERLRRTISPTHEIYTGACLACCLAELGEFREGVTCTTQALRLADEIDRSYARAHASFGGGIVCLRKGDLARAVSLLEHGLDACRGREFPFLAAAHESLLGYAYLLTDRLAEALALLEDAVESFAVHMRGAALPMVYLAECYLKANRRGDARAMVDRALALAVDRGERGHQGWALRARGLIAGQGKPADIEAAMASYREALALATELEMAPLRAQCQLALGQCYRRMGRHPEARATFSAAADLFRTMEMSHWLPRCETESQLSG
jgi:DNA-binding SARP family transcriptional activator/tetratricopeptide (TPR) repeat protein